jgi:lysozyme family protein
MRENFERALEAVLTHEGGYVNHPRDPGGETNMGISRRSYPDEDIRGMTRERAGEIYRRDFWDAVQGDHLPDGMDLVAFDAAVNSGVSRGAKWLQLALGVEADGDIGIETVSAARRADAARVISNATSRRLAWLRTLKHWRTFAVGWTRRVQSLRSEALDMARDGHVAPPDTGAPEDNEAIRRAVEWLAEAPTPAEISKVTSWLRRAPVA